MSQLELTEEEAAAVLANALRSEAEVGRKVSQAELLSIAREAGLSESAVLDQLAQLKKQAPPAAIEGDDEFGPLPALLPMTPQQAVALLTETVEVTQMTGSALGLECTLRLGSQKLRARFEPIDGGCIVRPVRTDVMVLTWRRITAISIGLVALGPMLEILAMPPYMDPWPRALALLLFTAFLVTMALRLPLPMTRTRRSRSRKSLQVIILAAFGREVFSEDVSRSRWDISD
jgi:hypothetical protein